MEIKLRLGSSDLWLDLLRHPSSICKKMGFDLTEASVQNFKADAGCFTKTPYSSKTYRTTVITFVWDQHGTNPWPTHPRIGMKKPNNCEKNSTSNLWPIPSKPSQSSRIQCIQTEQLRTLAPHKFHNSPRDIRKVGRRVLPEPRPLSSNTHYQKDTHWGHQLDIK